jgi:hypothetical protein
MLVIQFLAKNTKVGDHILAPAMKTTAVNADATTLMQKILVTNCLPFDPYSGTNRTSPLYSPKLARDDISPVAAMSAEPTPTILAGKLRAIRFQNTNPKRAGITLFSIKYMALLYREERNLRFQTSTDDNSSSETQLLRISNLAYTPV